MIITASMRTDIPAFYSSWLYKRFEEGYVLVRNPYNPNLISRYELNPNVVDCLLFCTKNPWPMLPRLDELNAYPQYWYMTITAYGKRIEPGVPPLEKAIEGFIELSKRYGPKAVCWRYDPIFYGLGYDKQRHIAAFSYIAKRLAGYTTAVGMSFVDLYDKVKRNAPSIIRPSEEEQNALMKCLVPIAKEHGMVIRFCSKNHHLEGLGIDLAGCQRKEVFLEATGWNLLTKPGPNCPCLFGRDLGTYNSCPHLCKYCYANYDEASVRENYAKYDPDSPLLLGKVGNEDKIVYAKQKSEKDFTLSLF